MLLDAELASELSKNEKKDAEAHFLYMKRECAETNFVVEKAVMNSKEQKTLIPKNGRC